MVAPRCPLRAAHRLLTPFVDLLTINYLTSWTPWPTRLT
jgi:hypothetical protein